MITFEKAVEIVKQYILKHFPEGGNADLCCYIGEIGNWWKFTACGPNGEGLTGALGILVSKETGETAFSCRPNATHPVEKENKYVPLNSGKHIKIKIE